MTEDIFKKGDKVKLADIPLNHIQFPVTLIDYNTKYIVDIAIDNHVLLKTEEDVLQNLYIHQDRFELLYPIPSLDATVLRRYKEDIIVICWNEETKLAKFVRGEKNRDIWLFKMYNNEILLHDMHIQDIFKISGHLNSGGDISYIRELEE